MMRTILHVDMDAFYASVEQLDAPQLRGQPVIVGADPQGGSGRGVVTTCSYEARKFGVHSAMPIRTAWRLCPQAVYLAPRFERYRDVSGQIMQIFRDTTDQVEPLSIDEAFLDVGGSRGPRGRGEQIAHQIKDRILRETGLTASVGVACNKFLAKLASDLDKPDGLVIVPPEAVAAFLAPLPITKMWGVGPKTAVKLRRMGVATIGDLASMPESQLNDKFGSAGRHFWYLAQGQDERPVRSDRTPKSISKETTFAQDTLNTRVLTTTLRQLSDQVGTRLRQKRFRARTISLKLRYASFVTHTRQVSLSRPTDDSDGIFRHARSLFTQFPLAEKVRLIGVGAANLVLDSATPDQLDLFAQTTGIENNLDDAVDRIHQRFGEAALSRASELP